MTHPFFDLNTHGFLRVAVGAPLVAVADPAGNAAQTIEMAREAVERGASLVLFPELGISAYAIDDLLQQEALLAGVETALKDILDASRALNLLIVVGAPLRHRERLYNCAVFVLRGQILAVTPKTYLPNYREFYERRHFASGAFVANEEILVAGRPAPFGSDILLVAQDVPNLALHAEICEDLWVPIPPSTRAALAGATVLLNLSASNAIVGKSDHRQTLCAAHSSRCLAAYLYSAAGQGESTTDLAFDGEALIYEMGAPLAKAPRFSKEPQLVVTDIDLGRLAAERLRQGSFGDCADIEQGATQFRRVVFALEPRRGDLGLLRAVPRFPFVPDDEARLAELCFEAVNIQAHGLQQRLRASKIEKIVIGVSGGLELDACAAGRRDDDGRARTLARKYSGLYAAGLRDDATHQIQRLGADARARRHRAGNRRGSRLPANAERHRPSGRARRADLRRDVRECAGRRANVAAVSTGQPE